MSTAVRSLGFLVALAGMMPLGAQNRPAVQLTLVSRELAEGDGAGGEPRRSAGEWRGSVIAAGDAHSLRLKSDGTGWGWVNNTFAQLGEGNPTNALVPVQVSGLTGVVAIAAGRYHSLALKSDGTVWAWGHNNFGQTSTGANAG